MRAFSVLEAGARWERRRGLEYLLASFAMLATLAAQPAAGEAIVPDPASPFYRLAAGSGAGDLSVLSAGRVTGDVHANGNVVVFPFAAVEGDASAAGTLGGGGQITGTTSPGAPPLLFPTLDGAALRAQADRVLVGSKVFTNPRIDDVLYVDGSVFVVGTLNGTGTLIASGSIYMLDCFIPCPVAPDTRSSVIGFGDLYLGVGRHFRGVLVAGRDLTLNIGANGEGVAAAARNLLVSAAAHWRYLAPDTMTPTISELSPGDGEIVADPMPTVSAAFSEGHAGIDLSTANLTVDGVDRTAEATISASGIAWSPAEALPRGQRTIEVEVSDWAGNQAAATWSFSVDPGAPHVEPVLPERDSQLRGENAEIEALFFDDVSGIDLESIVLLVDGVDVTAQAEIVATGLTWSSGAPWPEGSREIEIRASDRVGHLSDVRWTFAVDRTAPELGILEPLGTVVLPSDELRVRIAIQDADQSLDFQSLQFLLDDIDRSQECSVFRGVATCLIPGSTSGNHALHFSISDTAGNSASVDGTFELVIDTDAPSLAVTEPAEGAFVVESALQVSGTVTDAGIVTEVRVDGVPVPVSAGAFTAPFQLEEGLNFIFVDTEDSFGRPAWLSRKVTLDQEAPALHVTAPPAGFLTNAPQVVVSGEVFDKYGLARLTVGNVELPPMNGPFELTLDVEEGQSAILISAEDLAGHRSETSVEIERYSLPEIAITSPPNNVTIASTSVRVEGTTSVDVQSVSVNGEAAVVTGGLFALDDVPLVEGGNYLTAVATSDLGRVASSTVTVTRDLEAPHLEVSWPQDGGMLFGDAVSVSGLVNDIVYGTVDAEDVVVSVAGLPAEVRNRSFLVEDLPLLPGENNLLVAATDSSGNSREVTVTVRRESPSGPRIEIVSGDRQGGRIREGLAQPLMIRLLDAGGQPVEGAEVVFRTHGTDGHLNGVGRAAIVVSAADGTAQANFELGSRAGFQAVEATSVGFAGRARFTFHVFGGDPDLLVIDSGNHQVGVAGQQLPQPLIATVVDNGFNRLEAIPVRFEIVSGGGNFVGGTTELEVLTDADGRAVASIVLGTEDGLSNNVVLATLPPGIGSSPAVGFTASAWAAGAPAETSLSGTVLDNSNLPVDGATIRLREWPGLSATTDSGGWFRIAPAPVGTLHVIVDGSTVARPGSWADLEFVVTTIAGRDNSIGMPIFDLPIDVGNGVYVDETHGGTVDLAGIPGFAVEIAPGSVTFPGGSRSGVVSATLVHSDKVPMPPILGIQPRMVVTLQPAGARFDPPARIVAPNLEGLDPGRSTEFYSFDHDLYQWVSIGPGTVTDDGLSIVSDPGVGILEAGWHAAGDPNPSGCVHDCPSCTTCISGACLPACPLDAFSCGTCNDGKPCTVNDTCTDGDCDGEEVEIRAISVTVDGRPVEEGSTAYIPAHKLIEFAAAVDSNCPDLVFDWNLSFVAFHPTTASFARSFASPAAGSVVVSVNCNECNRISRAFAFNVVVWQIKEVIVGQERPTVKAVEAGPSGGERTSYFGAVSNGVPIELQVELEPDIDPSELPSGSIEWTGNGAQGDSGPASRAFETLQPSRLGAIVRATGADAENSRDVSLYVIGAEFVAFTPENGQVGSSFDGYVTNWASEGYIPKVYRPMTQGTDVGWASFVEYRFRVLPAELVGDVANGVLDGASFSFYVDQDARAWTLDHGEGGWNTWTAPEAEWSRDPPHANLSDLDPWDGQGFLHARDGTSARFYNFLTRDQWIVRLNLRTYVRCGVLEDATHLSDENTPRCSDFFPWRVFRWAEKAITETPNRPVDHGGELENHALPGNVFWGTVPPGHAGLLSSGGSR